MTESQPEAVLPPGYSYWAFLSYSHADNRVPERQWANWLHESLETYELPETVRGGQGRDGVTVPPRLFPIFQDEKELPTSASLTSMIETALSESRFLIVVCSPRAARSLWVNQEIIYFKRLGRNARILPIIVAGEPNASEPGKEHICPELECFPEALRYDLLANGQMDYTRRVEPIAADVRREDGSEGYLTDIELAPILDRELLRLVAGISGVGFDELVQRDKQRAILRAAREAQERAEHAEQLVQEAGRNIQSIHLDAPRNPPDFIFSMLGRAEMQLENALSLDPSREDAADTLRNIRYSFIDTAISSGDLNLASLYLERLRVTGDPDEPRWRTLQASLDEAWKTSDPARNSGLRTGHGLSLLGVSLSLLWARGVWQREAPSMLGAAAMLSALPFIGTAWHLSGARMGHEQGLKRAIVLNYFATVFSLCTLNPAGLVSGLAVAALITRKESLAVVWRYAAGPP